MNGNKTFPLVVVCTIATLRVATPMPALASKGTGCSVAYFVDRGDSTTCLYATDFKTEAEMDRAIQSVLLSAAFGPVKQRLEVIRDPSIAYNPEVTKSTTETQDFFAPVEFPSCVLGPL